MNKWLYWTRQTLLLFFLLNLKFITAQILPTDVLQNGYAVVSCFADTGTDAALAIVDMRQAGTMHDNTANHGAIDLSASFPKPVMWSLNDFGGNQILAIAIDSRDGSIYAGTFNAYKKTVPPFTGLSHIYHISADGNTVTLFATLPGGISGGWLDIDENNNQLYFSNFDDGMIYAVPISVGPAIPSSFAYNTFGPYVSQGLNDGIAPLGNRIWGVGYNHQEDRLYYSIWGQDADQTSGATNDIRSVAIDGNGNFLPGTDQFEFTAPLGNFYTNSVFMVTNMPFSDIEFDKQGTKMLVAEQSFNSIIPVIGAHDSRVLEYNGSAGAWMPEPVNKHSIGEFSGITTNARGGVDFLYHDIDANGNVNGEEDYLVATGDALPLDNSASIFIYGFQVHRITGGSQNTSIKIDLDGQVNNIEAKYIYGDVDVRVEPPCPAEPKCINSFGAFTITKRR